MGTGQNCTKTKLYEVTKLHKGTKLHEDKFAPRVNFAWVKISHGGSFLHDSKKKTGKTEKKLKKK